MSEPEKRAKSWRRWARRVLVAFATLLVVLVGAVLVLVHNLDHPAVKSRLVALVHDSAGIDIDYGAARLTLLHGIALDDVSVRTPAAMRAVAPELVHAKHVEAAWTMKRLESVHASGVAVAIVMDEQGATSFDGLGPARADPPPPAVPLSKKLHDALGGTAGLPTLDVDDVSATLLQTERGVVKERPALSGLSAHVENQNGHLRATLGPGFDIARGEASASAKLSLTVDATSDEIAAALDVSVTRQSFVEHVAPSPLIHAEATVHVDPGGQKLALEVQNTTLANGLATASAVIELPDSGAPRIRHAEGDIDFARALAAVPPELVPVSAKLAKGQLRYRIDELALDQLPNLSPGATVAIDGAFDAVEIENIATLSAAKVEARVVPDGNGLSAEGKIAVADIETPDLAASAVTVNLGAKQTKAGALSGAVDIAFARLTAAGMKAKTGKVTLKTKDLVVDRQAPEASVGEVDLATSLGTLDAHPATLDGVTVHATTKLTGHAPFAADIDVAATDLRVTDGKRFVVNRPLHLTTRLSDANLDQTGRARISVDSGDIHLRADATKAADSVAYDLALRADTLAAARPFVPVSVAVEKMGAVLASRGKLTNLRGQPAIAHHTTVTVERPEFGLVTASRMNLVLDSKGTAIAHEVHATVDAAALALPRLAPIDEHVSFVADIDRSTGSATAQLTTSGAADANASAAVGFAGEAMTYDIDVALERLAHLAPFAPGVNLSKLAISLHSNGVVAAGNVDGALKLKVEHAAWAAADASFRTPAIAVNGSFHVDGDMRSFAGEVDADELRLANGLNTFAISGFSDRLTAKVTGPLDRPEVESTQKVAIGVLAQDVAPSYTIGEATVDLSARRTRDGVMHISTLDIANAAGGTTLSLKGAVDTNELARRLSLRGDLKQDLAKLSNAPHTLVAKGEANVDLRVESPDLAIFRTIADVKFEDASVQLPASHVTVEGADGEVPILFSVHVTPHRVRIVREEEDNPYSSLRFADQHPLLSRTSFISIRKLETPQVSISGLVGNLQINQNIFSLRQFEMGIRGGRVTGQCAVDWNGPETKIDMHVRADGVQSSHGEPFTGSAALIVSAGEHSIEGRADILQIGKRHLLDLLDMQDPFHADPGLNRIRTAMMFGYPDKLRVMFDHGFASVHVGLGGIARVITIDDLKGVPIGPLLDQFIPPFRPAKDD